MQFSFSGPVKRTVYMTIFFALRQEVKECLLPREHQLTFHRLKRLPDLEEATGILDLEPNSQIF